MPGPGEVGVQLHVGTPFTARHVEWSYKLTMKPEAEGAGFLMNAARLTELKGAQAFIDGTSEDIEGLTVVDDHTVVFETASPKSPRAGHRADNEVALRKSHAEKAGHSQKNSPWFAHQRILTFFTRV